MTQLQSYIAGRWIGSQPAQALRSAIDGAVVAHTHDDAIDFGEALHYARTTGLAAMRQTDFQQRAGMLKALAKYLGERKEEMYALSFHTGATRTDGWVDIEGGTGTLFADASMAKELPPAGNLWHEGPQMPLGKTGAFAGTHVLVPRGGVAVHINAFNFPVWGLLEKFAPTFLAGMPCIGKPATATSFLTEKLVRLINDSGILPEGALQLVIGGTGDLMNRLDVRDAVTFTGSADTAAKLRVTPNLVAKSIPFNAEADSLNCAILAPDVTPDDEEFDLFVKEVAREMTQKAGQKCTAIRRALVPADKIDAVAAKLKERLAKTTVGDPRLENVRMGALASKAQQADVAERVATLRQGAEVVFGGGAPLVADKFKQGFWVQPTVFANVDNRMRIAQEEIFGPVPCIIPFKTEEDAIRIANDTQYGLSSYLWTNNTGRAIRLAKAIESGMTFVNSQNVRDLRQPFGGSKASGTGREGNHYSFEVFCEAKNIAVSYGSHHIPRWGV